MLQLGQWIGVHSWEEIYQLETAHLKAEQLQKMLMEKINVFFPEKMSKVNSNDKPVITKELKGLDRRRKREYVKNEK